MSYDQILLKRRAQRCFLFGSRCISQRFISRDALKVEAMSDLVRCMIRRRRTDP
jgi:hypothetical protein